MPQGCAIVGVGGFASDTGKTTLVCELLRLLPGWEAVKITRGHYRSCGKDAHACCVSHLLREEPLLLSGRKQTYVPGKDTGRYWDAGAANVHWLIVTDEQVEQGVRLTWERIRAPGVIVEGTSFLQFVRTDLALLAARTGVVIKKSARRVWDKVDGFYVGGADEAEPERVRAWLSAPPAIISGPLPSFYTKKDLPRLAARARGVTQRISERLG